MKRALIVMSAAAAVLFAALGPASAATTASGTLTVTATVVPSMQLLFVSDGSGVALTGSGTNAATLAFGNVNAYGAYTGASGSTRTVNANNFQVASPFQLEVDLANTSAGLSYTLQTTLSAADATNTWKVGPTGALVDISDGSAHTITSSGATGQTQYTLQLTIPFTENNSGSNVSISKSISFNATAN